ncbi:TWiK family of potassium channels protein 18 [Dufourea novaeangliae]|uniref:TWiK family of potassium channels protein 18 n=1 Tax=Dufourea novaeangliae TaxID=178035 RepID=A0A154PM93_DUFNO|nr:TWiK family of potassium channels protein 18 [Dufourea novaeangliae]
MEDSYTVHRRRKAAARRREKTPDPSSRNQLVETSDDDGEARRARMEKMADDAEQEEKELKIKRDELLEEGKRKEDEELKRKREEKRISTNMEKEKSPGRLQARENDAVETATSSVRKNEALVTDETSKDTQRETLPRSKEIDTEQPAVPRRVERRLKKKSRERVERHGQSSDSSDLDEKLEKHSRRTKSPEGSKVRVKKPSAKRSSGEPEAKKDAIERPPREKRSSKQMLEEAEGQPRPERRRSIRHSQTDDTDEDPKMRKSETFPRQTKEEVVMKRSSTDVKKQIIPLSNDSLIEDFAKAQRQYLKREQSILDPDNADVFEDAQEETMLRRRKFSVPLAEGEQEGIEESIEKMNMLEEKKSWFSWLPFFRKKGKEKDEKSEVIEPTKSKKVEPEVAAQMAEKVTFMDFLRALGDVVSEFKAFVDQNPKEVRIMRGLRNSCLSQLLLVIIYCGLGAFVFRFTEGAFETFYKCGVKRVKRDFLDSLWNYSHNMKEDDWKSMARKKLMEFEEQLHTAHEAGLHSYSGQRSWTFLNAVVYCLTVITTIGYGHISPSTNTGRAITIVYAIFGIPMFLIILADFGKLFTRIIKFLWAFVRRLYYTGSCRKVRHTVPVQEVMKGVQLVYDFATFKRPSQINPEDIEEMQKQAQQSQTVLNLDGNAPDTPGTPAMSTFAIDDEFNLPISVAIFILLGYIFIGATLFCVSEGWGFFESFYFVFISMSTIGFGDYVPKHPIYMMCSIIYLVFGLALTSMCINVVQVMLSDSFRQASQKIGATIGFAIAEEDGSVIPAIPPAVEVADVHSPVKESESAEKIAPKAKQEDLDV